MSSKYLFCLFFLLYIEIRISHAKGSCSSSCGDLQNIKYPFRLRKDPAKCGNPHFEINCEGNHAVLEILPNKHFYVLNISYKHNEITLVDAGLESGNCSLPDVPILYDDIRKKPWRFLADNSLAIFLKCSAKINTPGIEIEPCLSKNNSTVYLSYDNLEDIGDLPELCQFLSSTFVVRGDYNNLATFDRLKLGFKLRWDPFVNSTAEAINKCATKGARMVFNYGETTEYLEADMGFSINDMLSPLEFEIIFLQCLYGEVYSHSTLTFYAAAVILFVLDIILLLLVLSLIGRLLFAPLCIFSFLAYKLFKTLIPVDVVERFLRNQEALSPSRYSYNEIITITSNFKEKLGQGGFGSVFKGRLPGGYFVAVKMLGKSMGDGEDFINEVSTIGRVHHVNVVQLVGFCAEGSYRALVYEYMANGSLDKYIFSSNETNKFLTSEKLMDIALSVAKGLDYLHQGCNMRILHFDIKPHNILLDHKFMPKISDFGLAKFHPKGHSLVSVSAARGTIGYIAPELVSRGFGSISYKSDVYSFGMLLMDMAGRRKHTDMKVRNSSQIYYPSWIYGMLQEKNVPENSKIIEIDDLERKLSTVGLWCIQTRPLDRPSMIEVVEMLEANVDSLQLPPKPFFSSSDSVRPTNYFMDTSLLELSIISENI